MMPTVQPGPRRGQSRPGGRDPVPGPLRCARLVAAALLAVAAGVAAPAPAAAHPDILMSYRLLFDLHDGTIGTIGESWTFDGTFSQELLADFDRNGDGTFSPDESAAVEREVLPNLEAVRYFTYVDVDGADVGGLTPTAFQAAANNGIVTFALALTLPEPVDPAQKTLKVDIEDPDFSVYAEPVPGQAASVRSDGSRSCVADVGSGASAASADPTLIQTTITVSCR
ncbi:ABC-type uncharacterized transport system substrate-binding protein [Amorphus sp. MBR-141]